ncbi:MAG: malectin domain-containing carbohydrate-binding protein, partial [Neomegalonema sp.]
MAITQTFSQATISGTNLSNPTSLQFGPDGRLYVSQQNGIIKVYDVAKVGDTWQASNEQVITLVNDIPNHNDDGDLNIGINNRQVTGRVVEGTAENPILYVTSSDPRIGAGGGGNDVNLDTNSGIISRLTPDANGDWESLNTQLGTKVDLVIGLPRSEENHSTNGMDIRTETVEVSPGVFEQREIMYVMSGGHDNKGAPSNNFAYTPEYYYSAALLRVDLTQLADIETTEGLKGGTAYVDEYVYALPTLDDPTRTNTNGVTGDGAQDSAGGTTGAADAEAADTFGGNDGRNQAKFDDGGPVQVYSPGYRNAYDVVITEGGNIYTFDNGPNNGWGGDVVDENGFEVTSDTQVATNAPNIDDNTSDGDPDNLHIIQDGTYGGHPNPTRASGEAAGLWSGQGGGLSEDVQLTPVGEQTNPNDTLWDDLPEDWDTITGGNTNPIEGVYFGPDNSPGPKDESLLAINSSSNGITEYTADNIGDGGPGVEYLAVVSFNGNLTLMEIQTDGTAAGSTVTDTESINVGGTPLDVTALDNSGIPGSGGTGAGALFVAQIGANNIVVLEPGDPPGIDLDADNDGVLDKNDPLQFDPNNGTQTVLQGGEPLLRDFNPAGGVNPGPDGEYNIGMNGWMIDGVGEINPDVLSETPGTDLLTDLDNTIRGGAPGVIQIKSVTDGDAFLGNNTQNDAIQGGFTPASDVETFTIRVPIFNPYSSVGLDQNFGSVGFALGDGTQSNYLKVVAGVGGGVPRLQVFYEENDTQVADITVNGAADSDFNNAANNATGNAIFNLYLTVDLSTPGAATAQAFYNYELSPGGGMVLTEPKAIGDPIVLQGNVLDAVLGNNTITAENGDELPSSAIVSLLATSTGPETPFQANFADLEITSTTFPPTNTPANDQADIDAASPTQGVDTIDYEGTGDITVPDGFENVDLGSNSNDGVSVSLNDGDNEVTAGDGQHTVNLGGGADTVTGTAANLDGDTIGDFDEDDQVVITGGAGGEILSAVEGSAIIGVDTTGDGNVDTTITFSGDVPPENIQAAEVNGDLVLTSVSPDQILYRVNAQSATINALTGAPLDPNGDIDWVGIGGQGAQSTTGVAVSTGNISTHGITGRAATGLYAVPDYVPQEVFDQERWDPAGTAPDMEWEFIASVAGTYTVNLFMGNGFGGTSAAGQRVFDIFIEGVLVEDDLDLSATLGHQVGGMFTYEVEVTDGVLDIDFGAVVENPLVNAIEIIGPAPAPGADTIAPVITEIDVQPLSTDPGNDQPINVIVTFTDETGLDVDSILATTLTVSGGPIGSDPTVVNILNGGADGDTTITAEYIVDAPDGGWPANTPYTFEVSGVTDEAGNAVAALSDGYTFLGASAAGTPLYRVNTGGPELAAADGSALAWPADTGNIGAAGNSPYLAANSTGGSTFSTASGSAVPVTSYDPNIAASAPDALFNTERFDAASAPEMKWEFPVAAGEYVVNLFFAEIFNGITAADQRQFDVSIEGAVPAVFNDVDPYEVAGPGGAFMLSHTVTVTDGTLDIEFLHDIENPAIKGIEILVAGDAVPIDSFNGVAAAGDDFSGDNNNPDDVSLGLGPNTLVVNGELSDADYITFTVADGQQLVAANLLGFEGGPSNLTFVALQQGDVMPTQADIESGAATRDGGTVYGEGQIGQDLLPLLTSTTVENAGQPTNGLPLPLGPGEYTLWFNQNQALTKTTLELVTEEIPEPAPVVAAINAGGPALSQDGIDFSADVHFENGSTFTDNADSGNGEQPVFDNTVFETERFGGAPETPELSYAIPVAQGGEYTVELYFAEIFQPNGAGDGIGARVFDVIIEGQTVLVDFDILSETGGDFNQSIVIEVPATFMPETFGDPNALDIDFSASSDNAKISAIVVRDVTPPTPTGGEATLTVNNNSNNIQISNFGDGSFVLTNTGTKDIVSFEIDVTNALYPDSVFDPFGVAGDTTAKAMTINGGSSTGVMAPASGYYVGAGGVLGFEGIQLEFDQGTDGGFNPGESVAFAVDMDPNSIAGAAKGTLDPGADPAWDIGGVSGAELIGSSFTITFADGSTATGQLQGQTNGSDVALQGGSQGLASQDVSGDAVDLTVNGLAPGGVGTYSDGGPTVIVNGEAGQTARVVLTMGFIQPGENNFPDTSDPNEYHDQLDAQLAALAAGDFPANNAVDFQSVDVVLTGAPQDISSLFDFSQVVNGGPVGGGGWNDDVEGQLPIGMVASLIDPNNGDLPVGPVTDPVYLQYAELIESDLSLDKTVSDSTPGVGDQITFSLSVANDGNVAATGVQVEDLLPSGYTFVSSNASAGTYDESTGLWDVGGVAGGATETLDITVTVEEVLTPEIVTPIIRVNAGGQEIIDPNGGPNWEADQAATPDGAVNGSSQFGVNSTHLVDRGVANDDVTYGDNTPSGPGTNATGAPDELFVTERFSTLANPNNIGYAFDVENGEYIVDLFFDELFFSSAGQRIFDVELEGVQVLTDFDPYAVNGNNDTVKESFNVTVLDGELNLELLKGSANNPNIAAIQISQVEGPMIDAAAYENYAQVLASDQDDPDSTPGDGSNGDDDDATVSVTALNTADLELSKTVSDSAPAFGDTITFTLTVTNTDGVGATGVAVNDLLSNGFAYVGDDSGGTYDPVSGDWTVGAVGVGESAELNITATVNGDVTIDDTVIYRVNAGGGEIADAVLNWEADTNGNPSDARVGTGGGNVSNTAGMTPVAGAPAALFDQARWDPVAPPTMQYEFAVDAGEYEVRLFMGNNFNGTSAVGQRVFDVELDGQLLQNLDDVDLVSLFGHKTGGVISNTILVTDGTLDIELLHQGADNPLINGIEIIQVGGEQPADYTNYAQVIAADQADPDSIAGDGSTADDDDATVVVDATLLGSNEATLAATAAAPAEGGADGEFTVTLEENVSENTTIAYLIEGSATNGDDYATLTGEVVIAAGTNSAVIPVLVTDDGEFDPDETVTITLTNVVSGDANVVVGATNSDTVTISDNDPEQVEGGKLDIAVTPGGGLGASTFTGQSFQLTNASVDGVTVTNVTIDLSTGILPDMVFDPTGGGGDATASPFTANTGAALTGFVPYADSAVDPYSQPRNGGFDVLSIDFTDFDAGETFTFTSDVDPNSIQGVPGAGAAGAVSGYELMGATVTVTFSDGTNTETSIGALFDENYFDGGAGNVGGGAGEVTTADAVAAPTLSVVGQTGDLVPSLPGAQIDISGTDFTLLVEGEAGATFDIVQVDSRLFIASGEPPFDIAADELPFYANEAMAGKAVFTGTIGLDGTVEVPASLIVSTGTPAGGLNAFMAVVTNADGEVSTTSAPLVVKQCAPLVYDAPGVMEFDGTDGTGMTVPHTSDFAIPQGTIAYSFVANDTSGTQGHFSKDASFFGGGGHTSIYLTGSTLIARLQTLDSSIELSSDGFSAGEEYEVAVTFGPNGVGLWIDGNLVDSDPTAVSWEGNDEEIVWGERSWGSSNDAPFDGVIVDKQIYSEVLTASQIAALAANSSASNEPPVATDDAVTIAEDSGPVVINVVANDTDADADTVVVDAIFTDPSNGSAIVSGAGEVTYTPDLNFNGTDSFVVQVTDGNGGFDTATVTVTVTPEDDDPTAVDDSDSVITGASGDINVVANDIEPDGEALTVTAVTDGANGTVVNNGDGTVPYTPTGGFTGPDSFTYTIEDPDGGVA